MRPGSTCTLVPSFNFVVRPRRTRATPSASGIGPVARSEHQIESNPSASSASISSPKRAPPSASPCVPIPYPMRTFIRRPRGTTRSRAARGARSAAGGPRRAVDDVQCARVRVHRRQRPVVGDAAAPNAWMARSITVVGQPAATTLIAAISMRAPLAPTVVHEPRRLHGEEPGLFDLDARLRDLRLDRALVGDGLAERDPLLRALAHETQRLLGHADGAHAVVIRPGPRRACAMANPPPLLAEEVLLRDAHVFEEGLAMTAAGVVAEDGQGPHDPHAGCVERDDHHAVAPVPIGVGVRDPHEDGEGAAARRRTTRPPLVRVDHVVVTVAGDATPDVGGVGARDPRFGHREARACRSVEQRIEALLDLQRRGELGERLHVPGVGRRAVGGSCDSGDRPMSSHSGAYSRLVSPAPCSLSGRKRFHSREPSPRPSAPPSPVDGSAGRPSRPPAGRRPPRPDPRSAMKPARRSRSSRCGRSTRSPWLGTLPPAPRAARGISTRTSRTRSRGSVGAPVPRGRSVRSCSRRARGAGVSVRGSSASTRSDSDT